MRSYYYKNLGRYNLLNNDKDWSVSITFWWEENNEKKSTAFSETWPEDEEPEIEDMLPSEVLSMILQRLDSYWISTKKEATKLKAESIKSMLPEFDKNWIRSQIEHLNKRVNQWHDQLAELEEQTIQ